MRIHYLQHIALEHPGCILGWAAQRGHTVTRTLLYQNEVLPGAEQFDWLIIMGGPMNIYEEKIYPWLQPEKALIRVAIASGKVVIGLCLGSQLIADVLGGRVTRNSEPEIGWIPVRWCAAAQKHELFSFFPETSIVFQWHYDTFSLLPPQAIVLAGSEACANQLFMYRDRVFGFQFHLENTEEMLYGYIEEGGAEMKPARYVQTPEQVIAGAGDGYLELNNLWMAEFLSRLEAREVAAGWSR
ncbi:type 1 glutamine amidotransferase [Paenibacillus camerounensis]|uniref:type 1 glutamine amidotransferase n=1 Tax=Paenibacillus camerounensis TaxID=1243663 RepID=UPI0005A7C446|nr:type 1 glutamine amidotransferase [Paenibacillus camerounensis]